LVRKVVLGLVQRYIAPDGGKPRYDAWVKAASVTGWRLSGAGA